MSADLSGLPPPCSKSRIKWIVLIGSKSMYILCTYSGSRCIVVGRAASKKSVRTWRFRFGDWGLRRWERRPSKPPPESLPRTTGVSFLRWCLCSWGCRQHTITQTNTNNSTKTQTTPSARVNPPCIDTQRTQNPITI